MNEQAPNSERKLWYDGPNYTADAVVVDPNSQTILLIKRQDCGLWALPGGFIDTDEDPLKTAIREVAEEASLILDNEGTLIYTGPVDDPRNSAAAWIETTAYLFESSSQAKVISGDDASDAKWVDIDTLPELYGSHTSIVAQAIMYHDEINYKIRP